MKVVTIADEIYRDLPDDSGISLPSIAWWIRANIGTLNNLLHTTFTINSTTLEFVDNVSSMVFCDEEAAIFKLMYNIKYLGLQAKKYLGAGGYNSALEVTSNGATVRIASKTEIAKTYLQAQKMATDDLRNLAAAYAISKGTPTQVSGDDTVIGSHYPYADYYNRNPYW